MTPANKRTLSMLGFVAVIGICVAAFFVGKHAGSRKASPAPPTSASSSRSTPPSSGTSTQATVPPSASVSASVPAPQLATSAATSSPPAASIGPSITIPVHTSVPLSSAGENPAVLVPTSCTITGGVATATGTFNRDFYAESNVRVGDVVELYVYSSPGATTPTGTQLADLASEKTEPVNGTGLWQVSVPIDPELVQAPAECRVAVQSTHAFMGAGDAGG